MHQSAPAAAPISRCSDGPATRLYQGRVDRRCVFPLSRRRHRSARTSRKNPQQRACHFCHVMLSTTCGRLARRRGQVVGTEQDKLSCGPTRRRVSCPPGSSRVSDAPCCRRAVTLCAKSKDDPPAGPPSSRNIVSTMAVSALLIRACAERLRCPIVVALDSAIYGEFQDRSR